MNSAFAAWGTLNSCLAAKSSYVVGGRGREVASSNATKVGATPSGRQQMGSGVELRSWEAVRRLEIDERAS
ncbi:hypothetical protein TNCV_845511 [Trichonephila clavipes]|nr:hypothetical protein TNCV_845511 [Trichonephila clavipes]